MMCIFIISCILLLMFGFLMLMFKYKIKVLMDSYECGVESMYQSWSGISIPFFKIGLIFMLFDVEVVLLYQFIFLNSYVTFWLIVCVCFVGFMFFTLLLEIIGGQMSWTN